MSARALRSALRPLVAAACTMALATASLAAQGDVFPGLAAPVVAIEQKLGASLPLDLPFVDADGRAVRLGDYFARRAGAPAGAVVLVLGYYRCPRLCQTVAQGAIEALAESGAAPDRYRVLAVSIDPDETAADAHAARARDLAWADLAYGRAAVARPRIDALVGPASSVAPLARTVGFGFERVDDHDAAGGNGPASFAHAAGFVVVTPEGRVSRYFLGVRHDPSALRAALEMADDDAIGGIVERLVLLCAHLDPSLGRHTGAVLVALRIVGVAVMLLLAAWIWRHRRQPAA